MSYWELIASRTDGLYTAEDFESAAYRLVSEQVIYHSDKSSRVTYSLIERFLRNFETALEPLGIDIQVNSLLRYVYAKPRHGKAGTASVNQTLLALVLRSLYDEAIRAGQINDNGEALCDLIELDEKYRLATSRELPSKSEFDALIKQFRRWGIVKLADEQSTDELDSDADLNLYIMIRPAIFEIIGDTALQRLSNWSQNKIAQDIENKEQDSSEASE
jgi:hypothetical protein